jgi:transaldolase
LRWNGSSAETPVGQEYHTHRNDMNRLHALEALGQSVWYDNISRPLITSGGLARMVEDGLLGVTSNPTIFEKAIVGGGEYDAQIEEILSADPSAGPTVLARELMIRDVQMACDILRRAYDRTGGRDGFVSIEVTPSMARDSGATVAEARLLWRMVARPNLMVKIPATREGLLAIEETIAAGINVNVTLIFSVRRYREVVASYLRGCERYLTGGQGKVASVASVFVSRIDTLVDALLLRKGETLPGEAPRLRELMGKTAVANAKLIYAAFRESFASPRFAHLREVGAAVQRPLWASTSTKNPAYPELLYVDSLVGADTVNTVPPATYEAILARASAEPVIEQGVETAQRHLASLRSVGIDVDAVMDQLEEEGVMAFERSFDGLLHHLGEKRKEFLSRRV